MIDTVNELIMVLNDEFYEQADLCKEKYGREKFIDEIVEKVAYLQEELEGEVSGLEEAIEDGECTQEAIEYSSTINTTERLYDQLVDVLRKFEKEFDITLWTEKNTREEIQEIAEKAVNIHLTAGSWLNRLDRVVLDAENTIPSKVYPDLIMRDDLIRKINKAYQRGSEDLNKALNTYRHIINIERASVSEEYINPKLKNVVRELFEEMGSYTALGKVEVSYIEDIKDKVWKIKY